MRRAQRSKPCCCGFQFTSRSCGKPWGATGGLMASSPTGTRSRRFYAATTSKACPSAGFSLRGYLPPKQSQPTKSEGSRSDKSKRWLTIRRGHARDCVEDRGTKYGVGQSSITHSSPGSVLVKLRNPPVGTPAMLARNDCRGRRGNQHCFCSASTYSKGTRSVTTISFASNPFWMKPNLAQRSI